MLPTVSSAEGNVQTEDFALKCPVDFILNIIETSAAYGVCIYPVC